MATRGFIAIKEDGKYKYIYNHYDSDIESLGVTLFKHYKDVDKVRALINLGDVTSVGCTIENNASCYKEHMELENYHTRGTVALFREGRTWKDFDYYTPDRQWEDCKPTETEDIDELFGGQFIEWVYIFDVEENKWHMAYDKENYELKDLEEMLHNEENAMRYAELINIMEKYRKAFVERCLSA